MKCCCLLKSRKMASEGDTKPRQDQEHSAFRLKRRRVLKYFVAVLVACTIVHFFLYMSPRLKVATKAMSPALLSLLRKDNAPSLGEQTSGTATSLLRKTPP
ncbi:hypothetical protein Bbelb_108010 [Branchiostoma belcheri]|nr:hypothetical protein Bbelb_108010 [Branchiostoma belcheri]